MRAQVEITQHEMGVETLSHVCEIAGQVEISDDWRFCPWCGKGIVNAIKKALKGESNEKG